MVLSKNFHKNVASIIVKRLHYLSHNLGIEIFQGQTIFLFKKMFCLEELGAKLKDFN